MKTRIAIVAIAAAAFGWGFSALVHHVDQSIRPANAKIACASWSNDGCARQVRN